MKYIIAIASILVLAGCGPESSDQKQNRMQEQLSMQGVNAVGVPGITKFAEKRAYKMIIELRDKEVATWTYTQDMNGKYHLLCHSIGYGIPYATQYTNPMHRDSQTGALLPQADPNGLFTPSTAEGTWVLCLNPETKQMSPVYSEPRITVTQFALTSDK